MTAQIPSVSMLTAILLTSTEENFKIPSEAPLPPPSPFSVQSHGLFTVAQMDRMAGAGSLHNLRQEVFGAGLFVQTPRA